MYTQGVGKKTQKTQRGYEIPVPTRKDFEDALSKVAKAPKPSTPRRRPKK